MLPRVWRSDGVCDALCKIRLHRWVRLIVSHLKTATAFTALESRLPALFSSRKRCFLNHRSDTAAGEAERLHQKDNNLQQEVSMSVLSDFSHRGDALCSLAWPLPHSSKRLVPSKTVASKPHTLSKGGLKSMHNTGFSVWSAPKHLSGQILRYIACTWWDTTLPPHLKTGKIPKSPLTLLFHCTGCIYLSAHF